MKDNNQYALIIAISMITSFIMALIVIRLFLR